MEQQISGGWTLERIQGKTTSAAYFDPAHGEWMSTRAALHENIINALMAGKRAKTTPKLWIVMGGIGSGKSTLIASELAPKHAGAVVIDVDRLWSKIPEYEELAKEDWKTVGDRTYAEVRYVRDAALAEAAARKLDIILEVSGGKHSEEVASILAHGGYGVSVDCVDCSPDEARERINKRANANPTPEDNLWCSPQRPEFPDKFDYQNVDMAVFRREYERRLRIHTGT